ncbi:MAG: phosphoribosylformylglycinamidine cyclo-ligase, partial [Actinomycetes bacterium]
MSEISYSAAGVDIEAGDRAVELMKASIAKATRPEVMGGIGGFAGLFDASKLRNYAKPLLATSTDGVGTKTEIARRTGLLDTIGHDLVAMVVDDLVVCGAEPLFMTDYIAVGKVVPETIARIVAGIADGCAIAGCALIGGETAEHPGLMAPDEFDIAGAATGVVDEPRLLGAHLVKEGDALIAMASSGLHANGYSLVRHILATHSIDLEATHPDLPASWGELLATPTRIYAKPALALAALPGTHAMAHIT